MLRPVGASAGGDLVAKRMLGWGAGGLSQQVLAECEMALWPCCTAKGLAVRVGLPGGC